mmetsp:Transcript_60021/g.183394  ORF Transcript_60021/g.183394 Transcript_60021/m.183394 type:complete len:210 (+) Transcript_60021:65-694(+)
MRRGGAHATPTTSSNIRLRAAAEPRWSDCIPRCHASWTPRRMPWRTDPNGKPTTAFMLIEGGGIGKRQLTNLTNKKCRSNIIPGAIGLPENFTKWHASLPRWSKCEQKSGAPKGCQPKRQLSRHGAWAGTQAARTPMMAFRLHTRSSRSQLCPCPRTGAACMSSRTRSWRTNRRPPSRRTWEPWRGSQGRTRRGCPHPSSCWPSPPTNP